MGQVWEAEQLSLNRPVALKLVRPERVSEQTLAMFDREARAGGRLSHPGIVGVHAFGTSDNVAWIAMELVPECCTLRDVLTQLGELEVTPASYYGDVAEFLAQVADALDAAHSAGVIHRDMKPQNILVTGDHRPKVTDFGLARLMDESAISKTGDCAGTDFYMSPEQVAAKRIGIDHRTDIFSLGVIMYEMLCLRRPFDGDTSQQVAEKIVTQDPVDPTKVRSQVPREMAVITGKCLSKARDRRYATMREVGADLRRYLANEPIHARPPGQLERLSLWMRRNPTKSIVGAVSAIAFVVISLLLADNLKRRRALTLSNTELGRQNLSLAMRENDLLGVAVRQLDRDLREEAMTLWPAHPERIPELEDWLDATRELARRLADFERTGDELRAQAQLMQLEPPRKNAVIRRRQSGAPAIGDADLLVRGDSETPEYSFGWSIPERLAFAQELAEGFAAGGAYADRWVVARAAIARHPEYEGLELETQMGLVPLGENRTTGLWEFWHMASGREPAWSETGGARPGEASGIALVLLPPGSFHMGATTEPGALNFDPDADPDEAVVHEVTLSPFFLSKYEMTQAQWTSVIASNPSYNSAQQTSSFPTCPVESMSFFECERALFRLGLSLPTEAQWEYACRAGTTTPWWTGERKESLAEPLAANLADTSLRAFQKINPDIERWPELNDGFGLTAPAGSFAANPFGLHDMVGNVWEYCADAYDPQFYARSPKLDPVCTLGVDALRVSRGGAFDRSANFGRSANRRNGPPNDVGYAVGLRPALAIQD